MTQTTMHCTEGIVQTGADIYVIRDCDVTIVHGGPALSRSASAGRAIRLMDRFCNYTVLVFVAYFGYELLRAFFTGAVARLIAQAAR